MDAPPIDLEDTLPGGRHEARDPAVAERSTELDGERGAELDAERDGERDPDSPGFPDRRFIDMSRDPHPGQPDHALPEGAERDPLIDMSRDPTPGIPDHAMPDSEESGS